MSEIEPTLLTASRPLYVLERRGIPEVRVDGLSVVKREGRDAFGTDPRALLVTRSLLKPWQFLAADVAGEETFWSLGLASHSGQPVHMEQLSLLEEAAGAGEAELFCPRAFPLDWAVSARLRLAGEKPSRRHHPCSGKHLLMIASCRSHGDPIEGYWDEDHPVQKRVQNLVGQTVGERVQWVTDSCGLPTAALSAQGLLGLWEKLALAEDDAAIRMKSLWTKNPRLVGGADRLDSELMEVGRGRLVAKEGADGLLMVQSLPEDGQPVAGVLIKVACGYNTNHLALALWSVLSQAKDLPSVFSELSDHLRSRLEKWLPGDQNLVVPSLLTQ